MFTEVCRCRYKLWNPVAHRYTWRHPDSVSWRGKTYAERYINTCSFIDEYIGDEASKLTIAFVDPADLGFDKAEFPEKNIETIVVGHVVPGGMVFLDI
jgi:hypothetical protein